jgi:hypothetical protein
MVPNKWESEGEALQNIEAFLSRLSQHISLPIAAPHTSISSGTGMSPSRKQARVDLPVVPSTPLTSLGAPPPFCQLDTPGSSSGPSRVQPPETPADSSTTSSTNKCATITPPSNVHREEKKQRNEQQAVKHQEVWGEQCRRRRLQRARIKLALQKNDCRSLVARTVDNPRGVDVAAWQVERLSRMALGCYHYLRLSELNGAKEAKLQQAQTQVAAEAADLLLCHQQTILEWWHEYDSFGYHIDGDKQKGIAPWDAKRDGFVESQRGRYEREWIFNQPDLCTAAEFYLKTHIHKMQPDPEHEGKQRSFKAVDFQSYLNLLVSSASQKTSKSRWTSPRHSLHMSVVTKTTLMEHRSLQCSSSYRCSRTRNLGCSA